MAKGGRPEGGGVSFTGQIELAGGEVIDFDGTLQYGGKDTALTGSKREVIEAFENRRRKNKIEYAYATDADGNPVGPEVKGGKGSVSTPRSYQAEGTTFTHTHPREAGMLGGSFSDTDMRNFANGGVRTKRAAAKEGTYSITKGPNFDKSGFMDYVRKVHRDNDAKYAKTLQKTNQAFRDGRITWTEYSRSFNRIANNQLIDLHNAYRAGAKRYGYTYTLEQI